MRKTILIRKQALIFVALIFTSYIATLLLAVFLEPAPLANVLGFLALVTYITTLLPSMLKTVFPITKGSKILVWLLRYRRYIGITAFGFGLDHGLLMTIQENIDFLNLHTYLEYFQGITILICFTLLAITSNDWSVKNLKSNWKKLHKLTYLVIFLMPWHILDKMSNDWSYLTPLGVLLSLITSVAFIRRIWIESVESKSKKEAKKQKIRPVEKV